MRPSPLHVLLLWSTLALAGCPGPISDPPPPPPETGEEIYAVYCALCHGAAGEGYLADNANALSNQNFLRTATTPFLADAIVHGRPGTSMSAWGDLRGGPLTIQHVDLVVEYLRSWQTAESLDIHDLEVTGDATAGEPVFAEHCASCHGEAGDGMTAMSLNNPWFLNTASDGMIRYAIEMGRPDTPMAAYGTSLTDPEIDNLVALIRSWETPVDMSPMSPYVPDWDNIVINEGGTNPEFTLREDRFVAADDVKAAIDAGQQVIIADARATSDFLTRHITDAISLPFYNVARYADRLPRDVWIIAYCGCPHAASGRTRDELAGLGFTNIAVLDEGYFVWKDRGYGVDPPDEVTEPPPTEPAE